LIEGKKISRLYKLCAEKMDSDGGGGSSAGGRRSKEEKTTGNPRKQMPEEAKGILKWRNFMKKTICVIGVFILMMGLSGCFFPGSRTEELNRDYVSDTEAMKKVEDTVIQALETKDEELLKSIFSEKALTKAGDMDKGIEYIFDLYKGDFVETTEENHSTDEHIEKDKSTKDIGAQCKITTTEGEYILSWVEWTIQEEDSSAVGVYNLQLQEENDMRGFRRIAGIHYPQRYTSHDVISAIVDTFYRKEDTFTSFLSNELLAKVGTEEQLNQMDELLSNFFYSDMGDGWVTYDEVDGKEKMHTYYEVTIDDKPHIIHFTFDDVEQDKISVFQIVEDNGKDFKEETECGIYLP